MTQQDGYTKEFHRAKVGTREPALCGAEPPDGRPWRDAPKVDGIDVLPPCETCRFLHEAMRNGLWLAS